jgi:signal transduction histidine kinase/ActR/RegA family two-component response regulator
MREYLWENSPLGMPHTWSAELCTVVELMLNAKYPAVVAWGTDAIFLYNDAYTYMLGQRHPYALGRPFREVWPEIWPDVRPIVEAALSGIPAYFENVPVVISPRGFPEQRWFNSSYSPVTDRSGKVLGMYNAGFETTTRVLDQKRLSFQLKLADALRTLSSPADIVATASAALGEELNIDNVIYAEIDDEQGTFFVRRDWVRKGMPSMAGATRQMDDFGTEIIEALRAGKPITITDVEQDLRTKASTETYAKLGVRANLAIPLLKAGKLAVVLSLHAREPRDWREMDIQQAQDVAERTWDAIQRVVAEIEVREGEEKLRQADRRKDEFLAMLAHELRNPLAPIGAAAQLLQLGNLDKARIQQTSHIIDRQVRHMTHLIDDLLDVSRMTRGLVTLDQAPQDIRQIVDEAVEQVMPLVQARSHDLAVQFPADIGLVTGDKKRLVQIVANLVNNAAKYTPEGGRILVKVAVCQEQVLVDVIDNGIGMPPQLVKQAFDLFAQGQTTSDRSSGGLGIGLAIVKRLVELHEGTVCCRSDGFGLGSTFVICLPRLRDDNIKGDKSKGDNPMAQTENSLRVMIVDDNEDAAATLSMLLEALGHQVLVEHHPLRALESAKDYIPDVFLLDIGLPEIDGYELACRLRMQSNVRIATFVAVTGYGQQSDRIRTQTAGFDYHLVKPLDIDQLAAILANAGQHTPST